MKKVRKSTSGVFTSASLVSLLSIVMFIYFKQYVPISWFPEEIQKWIADFAIGIFTGIIVKIFVFIKNFFTYNLED